MRTWCGAALLVAASAGAAAGGEKADRPAAGELLIIDHDGKEHRLKGWKFTAGTRRLGWLAGDKGKDAGPEGLEFSEGKGPPLQKRIVTLVPLDRVHAIDFDNAKKTATLRVAARGGREEVLHGVTGYVGVNVVAVEAEADLGELGKAAVKFQGGVQRGIRGIRFPAPQAQKEAPAGREAHVLAPGKEKAEHRALNLRPLYQYPDGSLRVGPPLLFKDTVKLDLAKVQKLAQVGSPATNPGGLVFEVTLKDGARHPLVLIERLEAAKGKAAFLQGLIGEVPVGYKLFPMQTISELTFDVGGKGE